MTTRAIRILSIVASVSLPLLANAASLVTYTEDPNLVNSTLSGASVYNFNSLATGLQTNVDWDGVGSFDRLYIQNTDQYGGAVDAGFPGGSKYSVQGLSTSVTSTTLTLDQDSSYFGFWWSAGDSANVLRFYNDGVLVQEFTTSSLLEVLPSTYFGNPKNRNLNRNEPYAFINFYGDSATSWDSIVFTNNGSSGFESDNYTTRVAAFNPNKDGPLPGVAVATIQGTTTTPVIPGSLAGTYWETGAAPGAPAPPLPLMIAFGIAALVKFRKSARAAAV